VRVFLPTYRRAALLPRAIASLRAQTLTDWVCELHNDDPTDPNPARLVRELGDPRLRLVTHEQNLGPIATFNLFYHPTVEPFSALLEDDNTWEPTFLERMLDALTSHPGATLAWCNQRLAREDHAGNVIETSDTVNPVADASEPARLIAWGDFKQVMGARHANGAMVLRSRSGQSYPTPVIPFGSVEAFRERMLPHPLLYVPEALATFTVTQTTARRHDRPTWGAALVLLAASFLKHAALDEAGLARLCEHFRRQSPPLTSELLVASFVCRENRPLRRHLTSSDWTRFLFQFCRHPLAGWRTVRARSLHPDWWSFLDLHTAARFAPPPPSTGRW